jgi:hypothetical protein
MNKKGVFDIVEIMVYLVFVIIVSLFIYTVAFRFLNEEINTINLETFLLKKSLIGSESCLAYNDGIRLYQNVIDLNKFDFTRIQNCLTKQNLGYRITLYDSENNIVKQPIANLNARQESYLPVCKSFDTFECAKKEDIVLYNDGQKTNAGKLILEVIRGA